MDRDACLMYGHCLAYMLHKPKARVSSVKRDGFCHRITKFCMICPFSLRNKSVCLSDQAFKLSRNLARGVTELKNSSSHDDSWFLFISGDLLERHVQIFSTNSFFKGMIIPEPERLVRLSFFF